MRHHRSPKYTNQKGAIYANSGLWFEIMTVRLLTVTKISKAFLSGTNKTASPESLSIVIYKLKKKHDKQKGKKYNNQKINLIA